METYERIRYLRKEVLKLSQTEFGKRIGVSRSEINNIERNVLARPDQKLPLMKLIASTFKVNEEWLLTGEGSMDATAASDDLDNVLQKYGLPASLRGLLLRYANLSPDAQREVDTQITEWALEIAEQVENKSSLDIAPSATWEEAKAASVEAYKNWLDALPEGQPVPHIPTPKEVAATEPAYVKSFRTTPERSAGVSGSIAATDRVPDSAKSA